MIKKDTTTVQLFDEVKQLKKRLAYQEKQLHRQADRMVSQEEQLHRQAERLVSQEEQLHRQVEQLKEQAEQLKEQVEQLKGKEQQILQLQQRIQELERRRKLNSQTSHQPPSSDGLDSSKQNRTNSTRKPSEKPSGGQAGHEGHTLKPVDQPDKVVTLAAVGQCGQCGESLTETKVSDVIQRQVLDIPVPSIEVTEYQAEVKVCPRCGQRTTSEFPEGVEAPAQYGKRVQSFAVYLLQQQLLPEKRCQQLFQDLFSLAISQATLAAMTHRLAEKVSDYQEKVLDQVKVSAVKHLDETSCRILGKNHWLHVISDGQHTHYRIHKKRNDLLEDLQGVVVHDHWKPYFQLKQVEHALCHAHHLRELTAIHEIDRERWAKGMKQLLLLVGRSKSLPPDRVKSVYQSILQKGLRYHESLPPLPGRKKRKGHNLLIRLRDFQVDALRCVNQPEVPFTNNQAERDIRMMKLKQKISGGFRSVRGAEIFCTIRGFLSTQRKQGNNLFQAIHAAWAY